MNAGLHLRISGLLLVIWVSSVVMTYSIQQRNAVPRWIENIQLVRLLSPAYYIVSIGTPAYFLVVPIMTRSPVVIVLTLAQIVVFYTITFGHRYATVWMTANGRALSVALFGILAVIILPIAILWFKAR